MDLHVAVSQPADLIRMDCVKPWMFEMSYAWGVCLSPVSKRASQSGWYSLLPRDAPTLNSVTVQLSPFAPHLAVLLKMRPDHWWSG